MAALDIPASIQRLPRASHAKNGTMSPSMALEAVATRPRRSQRRPTKPASYELANHAKAYVEGNQLTNAYEFLYSLLAASTSISTPAQPYVGFLPPPSHVALASSLVAFTFKTPSSETSKSSDAALRYLQCVLATIDGPAYSTIRKAFTFPEERTRRRGRGNKNATRTPSPDRGGDIDCLIGEIANEKSLWSRAEDFWHIVGWAFNCSVVHKKRWDRWKLWLGTMLDFLESDWEVCVRQSKDQANTEAVLKESLIWYYVVGDNQSVSRIARRRIAKAVFAMATSESLRDYPEVWEKETVELKSRGSKRQKLDDVSFEEGGIGDYDSDEDMLESDEVEDDQETRSAGLPGCNDIGGATEQLGGSASIELRQRLLVLLSQVATAIPSQFTTLSDWFDNVLEDFQQLPIWKFQVLLSTMKLHGSSRLAFNANLLLPLVTGKMPDYFRFGPTQAQFEGIFLPAKATTQSYASNAKVSIIVEQMFLYMMNEGALTSTDMLRTATEAGIKARESVHGTGRGKRGNAEQEAQAIPVLVASSARLLGLVEMLEMAAGKPARTVKRKRKTSALLSFTSGSSLSPAPGSETEPDS